MRLEKIQNVLKEKNWGYQYTEEDGCGSIDFEYRGVSYHIWEFFDGIWGAETNVCLLYTSFFYRCGLSLFFNSFITEGYL